MSSASPAKKTFFWAGEYGWDLNTRETLDTRLGVFETFEPKLSQGCPRQRRAVPGPHLSPTSSARCASSCTGARFAALDSMNLWIDIASRLAVVGGTACVDCLVLNDAELKQLTSMPNTPSRRRARFLSWVAHTGPSAVIAKQGEYGATLITRGDYFALPAYPPREGHRPDRGGRHLRRRLRRLHRRAPRWQRDEEPLRRAMAQAPRSPPSTSRSSEPSVWSG